MRIGYLGVGNIGEAIGANAIAAGFDLMVYDLRPEPLERLRVLGAKVASSARDLGRHSEILQVSIAGDERIEAALFSAGGAMEGLQAGSIVALHSTMNPATVRRIAERAGPRGVEIVDAQVTGARDGAQARTLCFMVGGERLTVERCRPLFEASGDRIYHMGAVGAGASAKLAQQMMTCMNIVGFSKGLRVATAAGLDRMQFLAMIESSTAQSNVSTVWQQRYAGLPQEHVEGFFEGLRPALAMAHDVNVPIPLTALAQQLLRDAFCE